FIHVVDALNAAVTVEAAQGGANVYLGSISDSVFFNRSQQLTPSVLGYGTIGTVTNVLGQTLDVEARAYAQGTAPPATALEFVSPFPATQTTGTSAVFVANALNDMLTSLSVRVTLNGVVVPDPTGNIRQIVADAIYQPLANVLSGVADPALVLL